MSLFRKEGKKGKKGKKKSSAAVASDDEITPTHHVSSVVDMPEVGCSLHVNKLCAEYQVLA